MSKIYSDGSAVYTYKGLTIEREIVNSKSKYTVIVDGEKAEKLIEKFGTNVFTTLNQSRTAIKEVF